MLQTLKVNSKSRKKSKSKVWLDLLMVTTNRANLKGPSLTSGSEGRNLASQLLLTFDHPIPPQIV